MTSRDNLDLSRRRFLQLASVVGAGVAGSVLLAGCGGNDDDEPAATAASGQMTATSDETVATPTEAMDTGTATEAVGEGESTATGDMVETTPTSNGSSGENSRWLGFPVEPVRHEGGVFVLTADPSMGSHMNPLVTDYEFAITPFIFETTMDVNPHTGELVGNLAESWEISDDLMTYVLTTRGNVTWHDGEPFTAADVKFTFDAHLSGETNSDWFSLLDETVASVESPDPSTVVIMTVEPNVSFPIVILANSDFVIVAAHVFDGAAYADIPTHPATTGENPELVVGTGPFKFNELVIQDHSSAVRYDEYWGGKPHLDEVINVIGDQQTSAQRLRVGEIDFTVEVPKAQVEEISGLDTIQVVSYLTYGFRMMLPNLTAKRGTVFQDVQVRRALLHAIDRSAMVEAVVFGSGQVADSFLSAGSWAYDPAAIETQYPYDPELAGEILDAAGWVIGPDGLREKDGEQLAFTMLVYDGDEEFIDFGLVVQEYWRKIGVGAEVERHEATIFFERIFETFDFDVATYRYWWDSSFDMTFAFACNQHPAGSNWSGYCNPNVDALLAESRAEPDQQKRKTLLQALDNLLLVDLPVLPLYTLGSDAFMSRRVHNVFPNAATSPWALAELIWMDPE